jgi:hypothetical protein
MAREKRHDPSLMDCRAFSLRIPLSAGGMCAKVNRPSFSQGLVREGKVRMGDWIGAHGYSSDLTVKISLLILGFLGGAALMILLESHL